jgi:hypothetical protein
VLVIVLVLVLVFLAPFRLALSRIEDEHDREGSPSLGSTLSESLCHFFEAGGVPQKREDALSKFTGTFFRQVMP